MTNLQVKGNAERGSLGNPSDSLERWKLSHR